MIRPDRISTFDPVKAWFATSAITWRDVFMTLLVCVGCTLAGLLSLRVPVHRTFHRATVRKLVGSFASKQPNIMIEAETDSDQIVFIKAIAYNPELREGARICVNEMTDAIRGGRIFTLALPSQCAHH